MLLLMPPDLTLYPTHNTQIDAALLSPLLPPSRQKCHVEVLFARTSSKVSHAPPLPGSARGEGGGRRGDHAPGNSALSLQHCPLSNPS